MKHILVYGKTLFLTGLMTQLQNIPDIQAQSRESLTGLNNLDNFDTVLIDLNDTRATDMLTLLPLCPNLQVIGINPNASALTVLVQQVHPAQTIGEIISFLCT